MTEDEMMKQLGEFMINVELSLAAWNEVMNACNTPFQTPTTVFAGIVMAIQNQAAPQAEKAKKALEAVMGKSKDE